MTAPPGVEKTILERSENARCEIGKLLEECCNVRAFHDSNLAGRQVEAKLEIIFQLSSGQLEASASREMVISGSPGITNHGLVRQIVTRWGGAGNEGPVFVHELELMDAPKRMVPAALRLAGSHRDGRISGIEDTITYFLILQRTFQLFPRFVDWEGALTNFCVALSVDGNSGCRGASDRPDAVKRLHAGNGTERRNVSGELELAERFCALRTRFMSKAVRLRFTH